jgi:FkbM family methyltransferase
MMKTDFKVIDYRGQFMNFTFAVRQGTVDGSVVHEVTEPNSLYRLTGLDKDINVIVDIGANIGVFSTMAKKRYKNARVYSYEPRAENFVMLQKNHHRLKENQDWTIHQIAVCGKNMPTAWNFSKFSEEQLRRGKHDPYCLGGGRLTYDGPGDSPVCWVNACDLFEQILAENGCTYIDLLKIDCEHSEKEIFPLLVSSGKFKCVRNLMMEVHSLEESPALQDALHTVMWDFRDAQFTWIGDHRLREVRLLRRRA